MKFTHIYFVPFTGLGAFNGFRGNQWLKNRILIFKEFVLPSLLIQGNDLYVWFQWRPEEENNPIVREFQETLKRVEGLNQIHTFGGITFYDDKYEDKIAKERLMSSLVISLPKLKEIIKEDYILLTLQPSDDMYLSDTAKRLKEKFSELLAKDPQNTRQAVGYKTGYIMNYVNKEVVQYTTKSWTTDKTSTYHTDTIPPFFTILFLREEFLDPQKHFEHIGPYPSHEYIADHMDYSVLGGRGFVVGVHGENISTTYNHRYKGRILTKDEMEGIMIKTGTLHSRPLEFQPSARLRARTILNRLPFHALIKKIYYLLPRKFRLI